MPAIGIVDDRKDQRETLVRSIKLQLGTTPNWSVLDTAPLQNIGDYPSWIAQDDISVLIVDEKLQEQPVDSSRFVPYQGHQVIDYIRAKYRTLPIWVITAWPDDTEVQQRCPDVDGVIDRQDFSDNASTYVSRFIRLGTKFYQENKQELERLAELSRKIARGVATDDEIREAGGLQLSQSLPFQPLQLRSEWITKMEQTVDELADLEKRIRQHLEGKEG